MVTADSVAETGCYGIYMHQTKMERITIRTGKSRIRAAEKKRRTMNDILRIPHSSVGRVMKEQAKRHSKRTHECDADPQSDQYVRECQNGTAKSS